MNPRRRGPDSFDQFQASALFCPKCRTAQPVRERLLLVLPDGGDLSDYICAVCGTSVGEKRSQGPGLVVPS
jgi:hypothetical protein